MGGWREGAALAPRWAGVFFSRAEKHQKAAGRVEKRPVGADGRGAPGRRNSLRSDIAALIM